MNSQFLKVISVLAILLGKEKSFAQDIYEEIKVWSFRINNEKSSDVKAFYSGQKFDHDLTDFTICLRFVIHVFHENADTYDIFQAKSSKSKEVIQLAISKQKAHQFRINDGKGIHR